MTGAVLAATTGHATIPDIITFVVCAAMTVAGAIGVVTSRNPVHAALSLVLTLIGIAILFIEQDADFLAAVQIIVYAGAIVVLFLFVIMFLGVDRRESIEVEPLKGQRPLAFLLVVLALGGIFALAINADWVTGAHAVAGSTANGHTNVYQLGQSVFTTYLFAFEATAALLVIAVVGAVFLARRPSGPTDERARDGRSRARWGARRRGGGGRGRPNGRPISDWPISGRPISGRPIGGRPISDWPIGDWRSRPGTRRRGRVGTGRRERGGRKVSLAPGWYLGLAAVLFAIGAIGLLVRRNVLVMFMCIELMLNAANLTFVTFSRVLGDIGGQAVVFFVLVVAAAEVVVGLGIVVAIYRRRRTSSADDLHVLKG